VQASGGLDCAQVAMERYSAAALAILDQFPDSAAKTAMRELVVYVTQRRK
jgi:geranylgeranyl pyrophosphate synthase